MKGDLHCHTRASDGSMTPEDVVDYAARIGLDYLAVTDHDTMAGVAAAQARAEKYGVKVIPGLEVSTFDYKNEKKVHLLCYAPKNPQLLLELCSQTLDARTQASLRIVKKVASKYPLDLRTVKKYAAGSEAIYKQHIIFALCDMGYSLSIFGELFSSLFSSRGGWARMPVRYPETREVMGVIRQTGGLSVLAHPGLYGNFDIIGELCKMGLGGIEVYHPRQNAEDTEKAAEAAQAHGLVKTGGSDFHGMFADTVNPLASRFTPREELFAFIKRCGL